MDLVYKFNEQKSNLADRPGVVCPECFKPINNYLMYDPVEADPLTNRRSYIGRCDRCGNGFTVDQFQSGSGWIIQRWRKDGNSPWTQLAEAPTAPLLKTGPGGDHVNNISDQQLEAILEQATMQLNKLGKVLVSLIGIVHARKHG